ncbi:MAG: HAMP domain-containing histidine kinase [Thermoleophilia bacterium]|nr:HAMP domain-containing histidine kinase [Thermoleophilia bacterium]
MSAWSRLGLRSRLALSIGAIVLVAFAVVFVAVRAEMTHEARVIDREEAREHRTLQGGAENGERGSRISPIADAQSEVERTFVLVGAIALVAALGGGYLLAARTASPLRRMATTAAEVRGGDLSPRLAPEAGAPPELRTLTTAFNQMLDRLDLAFSQQRQFVSDASHELRTPLAAIRGQLEVLGREDDPSPENVRRVEALALAEMRRVERLVDDLLALARLEERTEFRYKAIEISTFLRDLANADPSKAELGELAAGTINLDADQIAQVVRNLLANARRAAGDSGRVGLSAVASGGRLLVRVDDDGPGIPAAERGRVFDRFHRLESSRGRDSGGSGLGLAISREIVEAHGGAIGVETSPRGGARVTFELPGFEPSMRELSPGP